MTASESTQPIGHESTDGEPKASDTRWERVGRELLQAKLERAENDIREAFFDAARTLDDGDELTEQDISHLRHAIEQARRATERAAEASPDTTPLPEMWDFLTEEGRREYVQAAEEDRKESSTE